MSCFQDAFVSNGKCSDSAVIVVCLDYSYDCTFLLQKSEQIGNGAVIYTSIVFTPIAGRDTDKIFNRIVLHNSFIQPKFSKFTCSS